MTHRQRALGALRRQKTDVPAVQYYYTECGAAEHGEKLDQLFLAHPGDFGPVELLKAATPPPDAVDEAGRYYERQTDEWGTTWEYRIFGRMGHAVHCPIQSEEDYASYVLPPPPPYVADRAAFDALKEEVAARKQSFVALRGGYSYLERLTALRGFEGIMMDLYDDGPELQGFLHRLTDHYLADVQKLLAAGVDAVSFGDDYGTQQSLLVSPALFRQVLMPHLERLMAPIREAGAAIHFHSCGLVADLFPLFEELGVTSIWPQLPLYDMEWLAAECKKRNFALAIHTDRAVTMTHGTPADVRRMVQKEHRLLRPEEGGGWFYLEVDNGFPYANIEALIDEVYRLRE